MPKAGCRATNCKYGHDLTAPGARKPASPTGRGGGDCRQCSVDRIRVRRGSTKSGPPSRYKGDEQARLNALAAGLKRCPECETAKPRDQFNRDSGAPGGLNTYCRACRSAQKKAAYEADRELSRLKHQARKFGISVHQLVVMVEEQGDGCAICRRPCPSGRALAVDHDHETGELRGLLCANCNRAIGLLQDSPAVVESALRYLQRWKNAANADDGLLSPGMS